MDALTLRLLELLPEYGPWFLFLLAVLETCFVTGLVVPSGVATSVATVLALEGRLELLPVLLAAFAGGAVGDSLGFWIGRWSGDKVLHGRGVFARRLAKRRTSLNDLFGRHPVFSVTTARLISFVRTVMPMAAGMSDLTYRQYLPYQFAGLVGWLAIYVAIGALARESWQVATRVVGVGGTVLFVTIALVIWIGLHRSRDAPAAAPAEAEKS